MKQPTHIFALANATHPHGSKTMLHIEQDPLQRRHPHVAECPCGRLKFRIPGWGFGFLYYFLFIHLS